MPRRRHQPEDLGLRIALAVVMAGHFALGLALLSLDARLLPVVAVSAGSAFYLYRLVDRGQAERQKAQDDMDRWVAQVTHQMRTPLTPIKGFLHTLQRRDDRFTSEDRHRLYEVMMREEQRLEDLVTSLLEASSVDQRSDGRRSGLGDGDGVDGDQLRGGTVGS